ncbi:MAG: hypothetical protein M3N57_05425, partial [Actinomycetota bacterium]|nr:hypothetical protein [Actinomycetota bacterium]
MIRRAVACLLVGGALLSACDGDSGTDARPTPTADATEATDAAVAPPPVRGEATVLVQSTFNGPIVFHDRPRPPADEATAAAMVQRATDWLDRHLTDLQAGGGGLLAEVAADGLLDGADPALLTSVTRDLTGPDRPVRTALYHVVVAEEGSPQFLRMTALVETTDG